MAGTGRKDVDIVGDPVRQAILGMIGPILIALLVGQVNSFVDTVWCSGLGVDALSAVSLTASMYFLLLGVGNGLGIGASVAITRRIGAGDEAGVRSRLAQSMVLSSIVSLALIPVMLLLMDPLIGVMGGQSIRDECVEYIMPLFVLGPFSVMVGVISGTLRAEGAARKSMAINMLAAAVNIVLDPLLIYGLGLGLTGAALATSAGCAAACALGLRWYVGGMTRIPLDLSGFRFRRDELRDILGVGIPQMVELNVMSVFNLALVAFVMACGGSEGLAVYNAPWKIVSLAMVPAQAIGSALIPVCSAAVGMGDAGRVGEGFRVSVGMTVVFGVAMAAGIAVAAGLIAALFTYDASMAPYHDEIARVIRIYCIFMPFYGLISVGSSMLQALRRSGRSLLSALLRNIILVAMYAWASTVSMDAIYWSLVAGEIVGAALMLGWAMREFRVYRRSPQAYAA